MISKVFSAIPDGYEGHIVEVEGDATKNLPSFNVVGMANKTVSEARERVRSAIINSNLIFPKKKVTVNLAPAELAKNGTYFDLPIALAILVLSKQVLPADLENRLFVGELSLDGLIRPVRGIINIAETAKNAGFQELFVPLENLSGARLVPGIKIIGVHSLTELLLHLKGVKPIKNPTPETNTSPALTISPFPLLDDIRGQELAKRALIIALAGHHNLLLSGPPGSGKTMLARAAANLLPPLNIDEQIAITKIHCLSTPLEEIITERPFRAPHHTASPSAIIGGGAEALPGEISLAHHGILFLDELPEFSRNVIEALRQPLEDHTISVIRTKQRATYPANFMLIATMNPCPCGHLNDPCHTCQCTPHQIHTYQKRISGPILDRIDLTINVQPLKHSELSSSATAQHNVVKNTIIECRKRQAERYQRPEFYNSSLSSAEIKKFIHLTSDAEQLLHKAAERLQLSARSYFKILRVSQTIADLDQATEVSAAHLSEALAFRQIPT